MYWYASVCTIVSLNATATTEIYTLALHDARPTSTLLERDALEDLLETKAVRDALDRTQP